jgi:predicted GNAT superfamily acetyltransferase
VMAAGVAAGHERVVCEVNTEPPNEDSMRMHSGMGFAVVGADDLGTKRVAYMARGLGRT